MDTLVGVTMKANGRTGFLTPLDLCKKNPSHSQVFNALDSVE